MATCRLCDAEIIRVPRRKGGPVALDAEPEKRMLLVNGKLGEDRTRVVEVEVYTLHRATCSRFNGDVGQPDEQREGSADGAH